ncbi:hypothetical protein AB0D40_30375 [Streptomyces massasporeus]
MGVRTGADRLPQHCIARIVMEAVTVGLEQHSDHENVVLAHATDERSARG